MNRVWTSKTIGTGVIALALLLTACAMAPARDAETVSTVGGQGASVPALAPAVPDPMALGRAEAPLALVEFSDYQCPYCSRFHREVLPLLRSQYVETGKLRLMYRDLPLAMHREALPAAVAARCAARQDRFWPMNEALFANQTTLGPALYAQLAERLMLDRERFEACSQDPATRRQVLRDAQDARRFDIHATPSFILGRFDGQGLRVARIASGFTDYPTFVREIEALLAETAKPE